MPSEISFRASMGSQLPQMPWTSCRAGITPPLTAWWRLMVAWMADICSGLNVALTGVLISIRLDPLC